MSQTRILAGKKAKLDGHIKENALSNLLTEETGRIHSTCLLYTSDAADE